MGLIKLYEERDIENLDSYCDHVSAMTKEKLHSKSDIAAELAFRDQEIKRLNILLGDISSQDESFKKEIRMSLFKSAYLTWLPDVKNYTGNIAESEARKAVQCFDKQFVSNGND